MRTTTTTLALIAAAALAAAATAADLSKSEPTALNDAQQRAELLAARQSWPDAIAAYKEAIAASPQDPALQNRLGICYQRAGNDGAARSAYKKAIALDKSYAIAYNNLGTLEHARGKYKQAIASYSKAIQLQPKNAVFHKNLGSAWLARGDAPKALEAWNEAFRLDPVAFESDALKVPSGGVSLAKQYYMFAKLLASRGETDKAFGYLVKAHEAGFGEFQKVEADKDFAKVIADPRYAALK
jgi:tetratricopeptide (TPR) repeat protein